MTGLSKRPTSSSRPPLSCGSRLSLPWHPLQPPLVAGPASAPRPLRSPKRIGLGVWCRPQSDGRQGQGFGWLEPLTAAARSQFPAMLASPGASSRSRVSRRNSSISIQQRGPVEITSGPQYRQQLPSPCRQSQLGPTVCCGREEFVFQTYFVPWTERHLACCMQCQTQS